MMEREYRGWVMGYGEDTRCANCGLALGEHLVRTEGAGPEVYLVGIDFCGEKGPERFLPLDRIPARFS